jgi:hypothetical protein
MGTDGYPWLFQGCLVLFLLLSFQYLLVAEITKHQFCE